MVLFCISGGEGIGWLQSHTFPVPVSLQSCLHSVYKGLSVTSAEVQIHLFSWVVALGAAGEKSCSFCTGENWSVNPEAKVRKERTRGSLGSISLASPEFHSAVSVLTCNKGDWPFKKPHPVLIQCLRATRPLQGLSLLLIEANNLR